MDYKGKTLFCQTKTSDGIIGGHFSVTEKGVKVKLVSFDSRHHIPEKDAVVLELEDHNYATLLSKSHGFGSGGSFSLGTSYTTITADKVVIGFRPWVETEKIKSLSFTFADTNGMMVAPDIEKNISNKKKNNLPSGNILEFSIQDILIKFCYNISINYLTGTQVANGFYCEVLFENGKSLSEISETITIIRTFLCFASGRHLTLNNYEVQPIKNTELTLLDGKQKAPAFFKLVWGIPTEELIGHSNHTRSYLNCWGKKDRKIFLECFSRWIELWPKWQDAFCGMLISLEKENNFDGDRLLNACKWLESSPGASQLKIGNHDTLEALIKFTKLKANELNMDAASRIDGALRKLTTESRDCQLNRLLANAKHFVPALNITSMKRDIHAAYVNRGRFAHRKFFFNDQVDFSQSIRQIRSVESLAFLVLIAELPLPTNFDRVRDFYPFSNYLLQYN